MKIKLHVPEGFEIDKETSTFEEIVFRPIAKLPKTWEEFVKMVGREEAGKIYKMNRSEASIALTQLIVLRDHYRDGWVPVWNENSTRISFKYCIVLRFGNYQIDTFSNTCHLLSFQNEKVAREFINSFKDLIEEASPLIFV